MVLAQWARLGALVTTAALAGLLVGGPAVAEPVTDQPVEVTATFDKESYGTGEAYEVTVTVRNGADAPADIQRGAVSLPNMGAVGSRVLEFTDGGAILPAGESREQTFEAATSDSNDVIVRIQQKIAGEVELLTYTFPIPVTPTYATVAGVAYVDHNGNEKADPGEELPGVKVSARLSNRTDAHTYTTTDSAGRYVFDKVLTLHHAFQVVDEPRDVRFETAFVDIDQAEIEVNLRGTMSDAGKIIAARMGLDKDLYQPTDTATLTVEVENDSEIRATAIKAFCVQEDEWFVVPADAAWGELSAAGDGAQIAAGATRTFTAKLDLADYPAVAEHGLVELLCVIGFTAEDGIITHAIAEVADDTVPGGPEPTEPAEQPTTTAPVETSPAPQGGQAPSDDLAETGANVIWLAVGGLAILAAGLAVFVIARRRQA